jgi:hypothetical protein
VAAAIKSGYADIKVFMTPTPSESEYLDMQTAKVRLDSATSNLRQYPPGSGGESEALSRIATLKEEYLRAVNLYQNSFHP